MTLQCHNDRVIIRPDPEHAQSQIIIPQKMQRFSDRGTVVAVGPGRRYLDGRVYPLSLKVGDRVLFSKLHRFEFEQDGVKYMVMGEEEILVVLGPDLQPEPQGNAAN